MDGTVITFNVGGSFFTTTRETLFKEPSSRLAYIARGTIPCVRDSQGVFFIDRDPKFFQLILNFMRDGWCSAPLSQDERKELLQEVRHYQLAGMEGFLRLGEVLPHRADSAAGASSSVPWASEGTVPRVGLGPGPSFLSTSYGSLGPAHPSPGSAAPAAAAASSGRAAGSGTAALVAAPTGSPLQHRHGGGAGGAGDRGREEAGPSLREREASFRDVFLRATAPLPMASPSPAYSLAAPAAASGTATQAATIASGGPGAGSKWTATYLRTDSEVRDVANALLELAYLAPHPSLNRGKVSVAVAAPCDHGSVASVVGVGAGPAYLRTRHMVVKVHSAASGWHFELPLKPGRTDPGVIEKYAGLAEALQEHWFVLCALLKDQLGVLLEEDITARPSCPACRRTNCSVTLDKVA